MMASKNQNVEAKKPRSVFRIVCSREDIDRLLLLKINDEMDSRSCKPSEGETICLCKNKSQKFIFSATDKIEFWSVSFVTEEQVKKLGKPYHKGKSLSHFCSEGLDWKAYDSYIDDVREKLHSLSQ